MVFGLGHKHETKVEAAPVIVKDTVLETKERVIEKEAIVNTVIDKPVLDQVIEKKNVEVHHKNVVQEIHEQPILEVEKMPQTRFVKENTEIKKVVEQTAFEKYDKGAELSREERERIRLAQSGKLDIFKEVEVKKDTKVDTLQDREEIREVIVQPIIERHQQAVVTEVHEKKVIVEHEHPVVRKIVEKPIVREIIHTGTTIETKKL